MENIRTDNVIGILQEEQNLLAATTDLLTSSNNDRADGLLDLLQAHSSKSEEYNVREVLELISNTTLDKVWGINAKVVQSIAADQSYLVDEINMEVDDDLLSVEESLLVDEKNRALLETSREVARGSLNVLRAVSSLLLIAISKAPKDSESLLNNNERKPPSKMFDTLNALHSMLFSIAAQSEEGEAVTVIIARCCERWWTRDFQHREELVTQLLPYLLASAMTESSTPADLKRLNGVRHALELLDFNHPSAETIKNLIVRCATTPLFLKKSKKNASRKKNKQTKNNTTSFIADEEEEEDDDDDDTNMLEEAATKAMSQGQRILSYALNLNATLAKEIWASIKEGLKFQTKTVWSSYGTIIFRAWKACKDQDVLDVLESDVIQDIMECGIKVADKTLFTACRTILQSFTFNKRQDGVDEMLLRLYNPILWRHLNAANHHVRSQATVLLIDAFPLQDPSTTNDIIDQLLTRQFNVLERLLLDPVPKVRSLAIEGVCRILTMYWDLIPTRFTKKMLSLVVDRLSQDASSTSVRVSVLSGLKYLVTTNVLSHGAMRILLPRLQTRLHDSSRTVRQSFLELLLAVRDLKHIPFFDIAPLLHLHARLVTDAKHEHLTSSMITLLVPTYYPQNERSSVQLERATTLLMSYPTTALVFFEHLHLVIAVERVCKLILLFKRVLAVEILKLEQQEEAEAAAEEATTAKAKAKQLVDQEKNDSDFFDSDESSDEEQEEEQDDDASPSNKRKRSRTGENQTKISVQDTAALAASKQASLRDARLLLVAMRVLWGSVHDELVLEEYTACNAQMSTEFSLGGTKQFGTDSEMTYFERVLNVECIEDDQSCRSEIFCLCGYLPTDAVGDLKEEMFPMLYMLGERNVEKKEEEEEEEEEEEQRRLLLARRESGSSVSSSSSTSSVVFSDKAFKDPDAAVKRAAAMSFERECIVRTLCNWNTGPQLVALATESLKMKLAGKKTRNTKKQANNHEDGDGDKAVTMRTKRSRDDGEEEEDTNDKEQDDIDDDDLMPLTSAICVLEDSIAGNVANVRSNILSNRKWFTNLLRLTYSAKIQLDARLREKTHYSIALKANEVSSEDLCRIFGLHCKLVVHGCALELIKEEEEEEEEEEEKILYFPSPLMKMVGWATEKVFCCQSNTTNTLGSSMFGGGGGGGRMSNISRVSNISNVSNVSGLSGLSGLGGVKNARISSISHRSSGIGLYSVGSSPLPSGPRRRRRRSVGSNPRRRSSGSGSSSNYQAEGGGRPRFTQLSRDVAVVITGIVADCALLGFQDKNNFIVSNVDMWENAFKKMLEEGGNNDLLKEQMKKLVKWCKKMKQLKTNREEFRGESGGGSGDGGGGGGSGSGGSGGSGNIATAAGAAVDTVETAMSEEEQEESDLDEDEDPFAEFERELEASRVEEEEDEEEVEEEVAEDDNEMRLETQDKM